MSALAAAFLGVLQGLTEFLPISSSAHLILARAFFGWDAAQFGLAFDVACHVGTLAAVLVYFRRELLAMAAAAPGALQWRPDPDAHLARLVACGTLPVVIVGLTAADLIETRLRTPVVAAVALAAGAIALWYADHTGRRARSADTLGLGEAVLLGCAQAAALVPGVSRSGATITVALLLGIRRDAAARFSFLLGVPAILAAAGKEALELRHVGLSAQTAQLFAIGAITSAVVGYFTVKYFIQYLARHGLDVFVYYRLALAAAVPIWILLGRT